MRTRGLHAILPGSLLCAMLGTLAGCSETHKTETASTTVDNESAGKTEQELQLQNGRRLLGYYAQWAIYGGHSTYNPCMVPFTKYTHINYAFVGTRTTANPSYNLGGFSATANPYSGTGSVLRDTGNYDAHFKWLKGLDYHADEGHTNCSNQSFNDGHAVGPISYGGTYGGNIGLFRRAKEVFTDLKFIISFGGWTKCAGFPIVAADATKRGEFCDDVVRIVRRFSADGADFDWEFPGSSRAPDPSDSNDEGVPGGGPADTANFTALMNTCRSKLDAAGTADGKSYDLTVAVSAGRGHLDKIDWANVAQYISHINVMTYDFHGGFDPKTGHQSALYANPNDSFAAPYNTEFNTDFAFRYLTGASPVISGNKGVPTSKVSLGMAFYTRGWNNVSGGIDVDGNSTLDGLFGPGGATLAGAWGPGGQNGLNKVYELKQQSGWEEIWDNSAKAHFLYSRTRGELYTYDSTRSIEEKIAYCKSKNCGGMFNWIIDGDSDIGGQKYPLISRAAELLGPTTCTPNTNCPTNSCGSVSDGCTGTLNCGSCGTGQSCTNNQCVTTCTATTCAAAGAQCGSISDGCTGTINCGTCSGANQTCNASNQCITTSQTAYQTVNVNATPVTIQAENYDYGGEGVAYHDTVAGNEKGQLRTDGVDIEATTDTNLGYNVAAIAATEWLEYTVNVQETGTYDFAFRFANNNTGNQTVKVYVDGTQIGSNMTVGNTGGWQTWATQSITGVSLSSAGAKVIKVEFTTGGLNFNWFSITKSGDTTAPTVPGSPSTSGATSSSIALSWTASTDTVGVAGYRVYRNGLQVATTTSTSYTVTGLQPQSTYSLGVSAYDAAGNNSGTATAANASTTGTCSGVRLYQNTNLGGYGVCVQTGDYNTAALIARGIKDNDISSLSVPTGYSIKLYDQDSYLGTELAKGVGDDNSLVDDTTISPNWNDKVSSLKVTTAGADTTAPTVPSALSTSNITTSAITLTWAAATDDLGGTVYYDVFRNGTQVATGQTTLSYTFTGLTANTTYTLGVKAKDGSNNMSAIATKGATTASVAGGNCGASAWSSSTSYSSGSIVKEQCLWNILCTGSDLNKTFAWKCTGNPAAFCSSFEPGAVNSNWSGIWTKLEECP